VASSARQQRPDRRAVLAASHLAGLDRTSYINWNLVPWYVSATRAAAIPTAQDGAGRAALRRPDSPVLPLITSPHPSASARRSRPALEDDILL
jgi:hypothetical protein